MNQNFFKYYFKTSFHSPPEPYQSVASVSISGQRSGQAVTRFVLVYPEDAQILVSIWQG